MKNNRCTQLSDCFRELREERDLTQGQLAEALGISRQSVNAIEKGKSMPSIDLAIGIASFFEKTLDEMFNIEKEIEKEIEKMENNIENISNNINKPFRKGSKMNELMPFRPFRRRSMMDDFFDEDFFGDNLPVFKAGASMPMVDFYETDKNVIAEFHMPGFTQDDVNVEVDDKAIYVTGEKKEEVEDKKKNYYHKETSYGKFSRAVAFPVDVVSDKADAEFTDGVLKVTVPKVAKKKAKKLNVKVSTKNK